MKLLIQPSHLIKRAFGVFSGDRLPPSPPRPKIGLALSSGGARGLAHIGVLEVLAENGIEIHAVSGSSMGAYIGAHFACGISPYEMYEIASTIQDKKSLWELADPLIPPVKGFFKGEKAARFLRQSIGDPNFSDLEHPFFPVTFNLDTHEKLVITSGNVVDAVHASCAIPGVIAPVEWNGYRCSDGGVVDPVPVSVLKEYSDVDFIIAVSLLPSLHDTQNGLTHAKSEEDPSLKQKILRTFNRNTNLFARGNTMDTLRNSVRAAQIQIAHHSCEMADVVIRPEAYNLPWHSFDAFPDLVEAGRKAAHAMLPTILEQLALPYEPQNLIN